MDLYALVVRCPYNWVSLTCHMCLFFFRRIRGLGTYYGYFTRHIHSTCIRRCNSTIAFNSYHCGIQVYLGIVSIFPLFVI
ncbi:hypothetical protein F4806DRAFT_145711 [Annulohypoxylon nitens]|nr:hypothetical protein F4806DRAFT_145711 [Annulohypoxylon nitens]